MFGKLKKVDLRTAWKSETFHFTPWLALDDNIAELGKELNIDITVRKTEAKIGDFSVDILAEESSTEDLIIIENQLDSTDHNHLGKIITYAANYEAKYLIWIVNEARPEHRKAIDWLNDNMEEDINLFLVKIELWQIGDSDLAPKFSIISSPNEWARTVKQSGADIVLTDTKIKQQDFWDKFKEYAEKNNTRLSLRKTRPQHWYNIAYGTSEAHIALSINTQENNIGCEIYIRHSKDYYNYLLSNKEIIEAELGESLEWMELPNRKASRIKVVNDFNLENESEWTDAFRWLKEKAESFQTTFSNYRPIS